MKPGASNTLARRHRGHLWSGELLQQVAGHHTHAWHFSLLQQHRRAPTALLQARDIGWACFCENSRRLEDTLPGSGIILRVRRRWTKVLRPRALTLTWQIRRADSTSGLFVVDSFARGTHEGATCGWRSWLLAPWRLPRAKLSHDENTGCAVRPRYLPSQK